MNQSHSVSHKWCWEDGLASLREALIWSNFVFDKLLVYWPHTDPSSSTELCQLSTQMGLWESQASVYQSLDVTPLFQTSMPLLYSTLSGPSQVRVPKSTQIHCKWIETEYQNKEIFVYRLLVAACIHLNNVHYLNICIYPIMISVMWQGSLQIYKILFLCMAAITKNKSENPWRTD